MSEAIKTKVTEDGVVIPKSLLKGVEEVEITKRDDIIIITPSMPQEYGDQIKQITQSYARGENPVETGDWDQMVAELTSTDPLDESLEIAMNRARGRV